MLNKYEEAAWAIHSESIAGDAHEGTISGAFARMELRRRMESEYEPVLWLAAVMTASPPERDAQYETLSKLPPEARKYYRSLAKLVRMWCAFTRHANDNKLVVAAFREAHDDIPESAVQLYAERYRNWALLQHNTVPGLDGTIAKQEIYKFPWQPRLELLHIYYAMAESDVGRQPQFRLSRAFHTVYLQPEPIAQADLACIEHEHDSQFSLLPMTVMHNMYSALAKHSPLPLHFITWLEMGRPGAPSQHYFAADAQGQPLTVWSLTFGHRLDGAFDYEIDSNDSKVAQPQVAASSLRAPPAVDA